MKPRLSTLGSTHLDTGSPLPPGLAAGRPLLLLVYLSCAPRRHTRAHLTELLWGDRAESTGRRALHQALYAIGEAVSEDRLGKHHEHVWLQRPLATDVLELDRAVRTPDLDALLGLYRGSFLADLEANWPVEFDHWVEDQRRTLEDRFRDTLLAIAEGAADTEDSATVGRALDGLTRVTTFCQPSLLGQLRVARRAQLFERVPVLVEGLRSAARKLEVDIAPGVESALDDALAEARQHEAVRVRSRQRTLSSSTVATPASVKGHTRWSRPAVWTSSLFTRASPTQRVGAIALLVLAALTYVGTDRQRAPQAQAPLAPLPTGLLVEIEEAGTRRFAVIDPRDPDRRIPIPEGHLRANQYSSELPLLSPDHARLAVTLARDGVPSNVYVIGREGRDSTRVSKSPGDDRALSWFPDASAVLIKSRRGAEITSRVALLAVAELGSDSARVIGADAFAEHHLSVVSASVSPLGTTIAVTVEGERPGLWLLDADGTDARRLAPDLDEDVWWSPDGQWMALTNRVADGQEVVVVSLDGAERRTAFAITAPGGAVAWAPDGSRLFAQVRVDGNTEVFSVAPDGSDLRRVTHSSANERVLAYLSRPPSYVDRVEILHAAADMGVALMVGDSFDAGVALWDNDARRVSGPRVDWRCPRPDVCSVRDGWIHATGVGLGMLIADAGGWRADTVRMTVSDAGRAPHVLFLETWDGGIDTGRWKLFGHPLPVVVADQGRGGSPGFQANGDSLWESGVVTRDVLDYSLGLTVDVWGAGVFRPGDALWQYFIAGVTQQRLEVFEGEAEGVEPIVGVVVAGDRADVPVRMEFMGSTTEEFVGWDPEQWHRYTVQILPSGDAELWIDGEFWWRAPDALRGTRSARVVLAGRAFDWPVTHDDLAVYEGLLFRR